MIPVKLLRSIELPTKSMGEWLRSLLLGIARPRIGGVDLCDADTLGVALPLTAVYLATIFSVFIGFFTMLTLRQTDMVYFSAAMNESGTTCQTVPLTITDTFYGSYDGLWSTDPAYDPSKTTLKAIFNRASFDTPIIFAETIVGLVEGIATYVALAKNRTALNALLRLYGTLGWDSSVSISVPISSVAAFWGDIDLIGLSGSKGSFCAVPLTGYLDTSTLSFALDASQSIIRNSSVPRLLEQDVGCRRLWGTGTTSTSLDFGSRLFTFQLDAIFSSFSWSQTYDEIEWCQVNTTYGSFNSIARPGFIGYVWVTSYLISTSGSPSWCLDKASTLLHNFTSAEHSGPDVCYVDDGRNEQRYYYPVVTQFFVDANRCGANGVCPYALCECPDAMNQPDCNQRQYTIALFYSDSVETMVKFGLKMQHFYFNDPDNGDLEILRAVAPVIGYTLNVQQDSEAASLPIKSWFDASTNKHVDNSWAHGKSYRQLLDEAWGQLCETNDCDCGVVVFQVKNPTKDWPFTNSYTSFEALKRNASAPPGVMACQDYSFSPAMIAKLGANPPTPLHNNYYVCSKTPVSALLASFGPAVATTNFFSTLCWIVLGYLSIFVARRRYKQTVLSANSKAVVGEALGQAKEESLLAVVQEMAVALQSVREDLRSVRSENRALSLKLAALEQTTGESSPLFDVPDLSVDDVPLRGAFEQFQRLHRLHLQQQPSDEDCVRAGQAVTAALSQRFAPKGIGTMQQQHQRDEDKCIIGQNETAHGELTIELVDNPMRLSVRRSDNT